MSYWGLIVVILGYFGLSGHIGIGVHLWIKLVPYGITLDYWGLLYCEWHPQSLSSVLATTGDKSVSAK